MSDRLRLVSLHRYPVKGLSPEPLDEARLVAGAHFPGDRLYAVENGPSGFDPQRPEHQDKAKFLVLARNASLARLHARYDDRTTTLSIAADDVEAARGDLSTAAGRAEIEAFFRLYCEAELRGAPRVMTAPDGFRFMDARTGYLSIINLATIRALEAETGKAIDPLRFRANLYVDGAPAFAEFDWVGKKIHVGETTLRGLKRTERCAATSVNPKNAQRDLMIPAILMRTYGHADCGIYCSIAQGGVIRAGDAIRVESEERADLPF